PLTAKQQKIRKEIAQEVEKRSKRILSPSEPRESTSAAKWATLPGAGPRTLLEMHREAERLYMDLQSEVMSIRMVPVGPLFRQFVRSVRDLARSHGKM